MSTTSNPISPPTTTTAIGSPFAPSNTVTIGPVVAQGAVYNCTVKISNEPGKNPKPITSKFQLWKGPALLSEQEVPFSTWSIGNGDGFVSEVILHSADDISRLTKSIGKSVLTVEKLDDGSFSATFFHGDVSYAPRTLVRFVQSENKVVHHENLTKALLSLI